MELWIANYAAFFAKKKRKKKKSFPIDSLTTNNAVYHDSLTLNETFEYSRVDMPEDCNLSERQLSLSEKELLTYYNLLKS